MDFAHPPSPIDGIYFYVLSVRDLSSGKSLLWLPVKNKDGNTVRNGLLSLFIQHGAPLVLKIDNDKAFLFNEVRDLLEEWKAVFLISPIYTPAYNGACESGIGTLKTYAHHEAARNDRPGEWTCDDVEAARLRANDLSRPNGHLGPSPTELWKNRSPIPPIERWAFNEVVEKHRERCLDEFRKEKQKVNLNQNDRNNADRRAIASALIACGILLVQRRRISPPIKSKFWARIM
jgi:hypothetical protein